MAVAILARAILIEQRCLRWRHNWPRHKRILQVQTSTRDWVSTRKRRSRAKSRHHLVAKPIFPRVVIIQLTIRDAEQQTRLCHLGGVSLERGFPKRGFDGYIIPHPGFGPHRDRLRDVVRRLLDQSLRVNCVTFANHLFALEDQLGVPVLGRHHTELMLPVHEVAETRLVCFDRVLVRAVYVPIEGTSVDSTHSTQRPHLSAFSASEIA